MCLHNKSVFFHTLPCDTFLCLFFPPYLANSMHWEILCVAFSSSLHWEALVWINFQNIALPLESLYSVLNKGNCRHCFSTGGAGGHIPVVKLFVGFPDGSDRKESACNAGDPGLIPGSERSPGDGGGYPLQYSCLENPMNREARQATVHGVTKSQTRLSD